jgi:hypothetical protein
MFQQWDVTEVLLVIGAFGTMLVSVIASIGAAVQASRANNVSQRTDVKADVIIGKAKEIHDAANSNLSTVTSANSVLAEKVEGLLKLVESLTTARASADRVAGQLASAIGSVETKKDQPERKEP